MEKFATFLFQFCSIQEHIAYHTQIPADKQLIVSHIQPLTELVGERTKVEHFPKVILKSDIFVYEKENYDSKRLKEAEIRKLSFHPMQ